MVTVVSELTPARVHPREVSSPEWKKFFVIQEAGKALVSALEANLTRAKVRTRQKGFDASQLKVEIEVISPGGFLSLRETAFRIEGTPEAIACLKSYLNKDSQLALFHPAE